MAYEQTAFIKKKGGKKAPEGFHYMSSGKLMSDADHIARYGYIEKTISSVSLDYKDIPPTGSSRTITIKGNAGFVFSIEIYEGNKASYYNFKTKTWSATSYKKTNIQSISGGYAITVDFPAQSALKTFTINVYAETVENIRTKHVAFNGVRYEHGGLNQNLSYGSDSNVLTKVLYQDVIKNLYLSFIAPSQHATSGSEIVGTTSNSNRIVISGDATDSNVVQVGDKVTSGTDIPATIDARVTKVNPDNDNVNEIEINAADSVTNDAEIVFTPNFNTLTPHYTDNTTGRVALEVASGSSGSFNFKILAGAGTGRAIFAHSLPVSDDLCVVQSVVIGAAGIPITGETNTGSQHHRWPVANIGIRGDTGPTLNISVINGMALDPARSDVGSAGGANTSANSFISDYNVPKTLQRINESNRYYTDVNDYTEQDLYVSGVDPAGNAVTKVDRNGKAMEQKGNITFNIQQVNAIAGDTVRLIAQGTSAILSSTEAEVSISGVTVTQDELGVVTTAATSASTTIPINQTAFIVPGQTISGVGINSAVADPTVISKSTASGAGNIVVSSAQTLEDALTLSVNGPTAKFDITGTLNIKNMPISDLYLYLNVERFVASL